MRLTVIQLRMAFIFNEWAKRFAENPEQFTSVLDENGKPYEDYGVTSAIYFTRIADELDEEGKLPRLE